VVGGRRFHIRGRFARQANLHPVTGRVRGDAGEVERLREHGDALADRLALVALLVQNLDQAGDVGGSDLVDSPRSGIRIAANSPTIHDLRAFASRIVPKEPP
jgi:hypothetical protein